MVSCALAASLLACDGPVVKSCGATGGVRAAAPGWPNEPVGFRALSDEPFDALAGNGWRVVQRQRTNGSGVSLTSDPTAPASPPSILQFTYAPGFQGGSEPGAEYFDAPTPVRDTYVGLWWKPSDPWENHAASGVNKIAFLYTELGSALALLMFRNDSGYTVQVTPEFASDTRRLAPNLNATPVALGAWHRIEWHVRYSSTPATRDGLAEWWLDGVPQGRYQDLQMPADAGFLEYQLAPTWGGVGGAKSELDCFWYDQVHVSTAP